MMRVVVASLNPVKIAAVQQALERLFPDQKWEVVGQAVESGVSDQPCSDAETLQGARQRAWRARERFPEAGLWVGIEGGVQEQAEGMASFAWVVVCSRERIGQARSGTFFLPPAVANRVREGYELGEADDMVFGLQHSKQRMGAVGLLTQGAIDRTALYRHAVLLALIPWVHPDLFPAG